jgi:hypothetical protein
MYHSILRVLLLVTAIVYVFDGGFFLPITKQLSDNTIRYLAGASSGVFASVPPNELNTLTAQLTERERQLDARESALKEREITARSYGEEAPDYSTFILSVILFILTVLIVLNYAMDWARIRSYRYEKSMG